MRILARLLRRSQRVLVAPQAVVQHGARPLRNRESHSLPAGNEFAGASFDPPRHLILAATERIKLESPVHDGTAGRIGERVGLGAGGCGCRHLPPENVYSGARAEREPKHGKSARVTSNLDVAPSERIPAFVVPDERGYPTGQVQ